MIVKKRNPRNEYASFDDARHQYWVGTNEDEDSRTIGEMVSVTTLISQFYQFGPFGGVDADIEFGKRVHYVAACALRGDKPDIKPNDDNERKTFSAVWKYAKRLKDYNEMLMTEDIVFSSQLSVAGTIDFAFKSNGKIFVCDWKTGNLTLPAKCKFVSPFHHLVADPMTIYSLQCSMYQVLMEIGGYAPSATFAPARLLWVHNGSDGEPCVDAIACRDLRREAAMMICGKCYTKWWKEYTERQPW